MAKTPRKTQDPTEAALSAIEEALKLGDDTSAQAPAPAGEPAANDPSRMAPPSPSQRQGRRLERANRGPANDDRQAVGQILSALNKKASFLPYVIASGLALWWVLMTLIIGYARSRDEIASGISIFDLPGFWTFFTLLVLPPVAMILMAGFIRRTQEMRMVARAMTEVTVRLAEPEGVSTDAIVSVGQAIRREVAALGDGIERAIARATELETMVREEVSTLERAYDENEMRIRTLVEELQSERDGIVSHGTRLREAVASAHDGFNLDVKSVSDSVNAVVDQAVMRITDHILAQSETARSQVEEAGNIVLESFTSKSNDMTDRLTQVGLEVANAISARTAKVTDELDESMEEIAGAIATKGDAMREVLTARLRAAEDSIAQRGGEIADRISADSAALARRITDGLSGFDTTVRVYGTGLLEQITQTVDYVNEHTRSTLSNFDEKVGAKIRETHEGIDTRFATIQEVIDTRAKMLNDSLAARTAELANTLTEGSKITTEAMEKSLAGADEYFAGKAVQIAKTLSDKTEQIDATLGQRAVAITESLDGRIKVFEMQVTERLESITDSIEKRGVAAADHLATRVQGVTQDLAITLDNAAGHITSSTSTAANDLTATVANATSDISAKVEAVSRLLRSDAGEVEKTLVALADQVSKTLIDRTREVTLSHETLKNDVTNVLAQLAEANTLLRTTLDGLTENLTPLAGTVTERISNFQAVLENTLLSSRSSIEHMDGQMRDLRDISTGVVRDIGILTQRFEDQGRFISGAADTLQETHRRIDQTLSDRRDAIERFTSLLGNRASDMEERLIRFNRLLQDSLGAAEERAHEIAKLVADSTAQSTSAISQQYDVLRSHSEEERERTAASLKQSYDKTMDEVRAIFGDANQRFGQAAQELREVASEVQAALETTRQEIKRGVLELPHETQESTNAMRRVVADQIKALAELNEIVSRHARGIDVVEPRQLAAPGAGAGPRIVATREHVAEYAAPAQRSPMLRTTPMRAVEAEPAEAAPLPPRRGGGNAQGPRQTGAWLNELLAQSQPPEKDEDASISLDSLSVDIARMIDHDSAVEFWSRYKRGERNVVTRRLYTQQGQKTFEEIRKRYRKSAAFRETVDRYIDEFERLLEQVSRDDRGQALSKTYLTSDTGKVYTLLSHAAGRLG
jgi:hypothetical protein